MLCNTLGYIYFARVQETENVLATLSNDDEMWYVLDLVFGLSLFLFFLGGGGGGGGAKLSAYSML